MIRPLRRVRAALVTLGLLATSALLGVAAPTAARASGCGPADVAVAVNFSHWGGPARVGCVAWSPSLTGVTALQGAGFDLTGTARYGLAFICRINGQPSAGAPDHENCQQTPPTSKYWSYWHANAGQTSWSYSTLGAASYHPQAGSADAWTFGGGSAPPISPSSVLPRSALGPTPGSIAPPATITRGTNAPTSRPGPGNTSASAATRSSSRAPSSTRSVAKAPTSSGGVRTTTAPVATTTTTGPKTSGSTRAAGPALTCTSTSTGASSGPSDCASTPAIVSITSSVASAGKAGGSPLPTIAVVVVVAALAAGGGGYAWRRRAGTHGD